jgi:hypothetical protein
MAWEGLQAGDLLDRDRTFQPCALACRFSTGDVQIFPRSSVRLARTPVARVEVTILPETLFPFLTVESCYFGNTRKIRLSNRNGDRRCVLR